MDNQQGPTEQHRELCSMLCGSLDGRGVWGRMDKRESLHCSPKTITTLLTGYQFSSVTQSCLSLYNPMDFSTPALQLPELAQTHVHWVRYAIQPSHPLSSPSPPAFTLSQNQGLFQWGGSLHQVVKVLELQLQHQPFQRILRTDFF